MQTLEEIKEAVAQQEGFSSFRQMSYAQAVSDNVVNQVARLYAEEQSYHRSIASLEKAAENATCSCSYDGTVAGGINKHSITSSDNIASI